MAARLMAAELSGTEHVSLVVAPGDGSVAALLMAAELSGTEHVSLVVAPGDGSVGAA